jgi:hypothetical protein
MRYANLFFICFIAVACQKRSNDVWRNYDWLPPGSEYANPYLIPPDAQRGYYGQPSVPYDNDRYYVPPSDFGICGGNSGLNCTE